MSPQELFNLSDPSFFYCLCHIMTWGGEKKKKNPPNELFFYLSLTHQFLCSNFSVETEELIKNVQYPKLWVMKEYRAVCRWYWQCGLQVRFTCRTGCWEGVVPGTKYPAPYCCTGTCFAAVVTPAWHQRAGLLPMCDSWVCAWPGFFFFFSSLQRKKVWSFSKIRKPQRQLPYKYLIVCTNSKQGWNASLWV